MLFLDCVWQMINQYPAAFEFTETYLTVLSDSMWIPLFSTFLFNSSKQRSQCLMVCDASSNLVFSGNIMYLYKSCCVQLTLWTLDIECVIKVQKSSCIGRVKTWNKKNWRQITLKFKPALHVKCSFIFYHFTSHFMSYNFWILSEFSVKDQK